MNRFFSLGGGEGGIFRGGGREHGPACQFLSELAGPLAGREGRFSLGLDGTGGGSVPVGTPLSGRRPADTITPPDATDTTGVGQERGGRAALRTRQATPTIPIFSPIASASVKRTWTGTPQRRRPPVLGTRTTTGT